MALNDYETDPERGQPVELYQIVYGTGPTDYYAYTNAEQAVTHNAIIYTPLAIDRDKIETKGKLESNEIKVEVPINAPVADLFRVYPPSREVSIIVRQGHVPNPDDPGSYALGENFPVVWSGRVLESSRDGIVASLVCESLGAGMKRTGLRRHYQYPCPLVLYGARCQANKANATVTATVSSVSGNRVTLAVSWNTSGYGIEAFAGGLAEWTGSTGPEARTIRRVDAADSRTLVLSGPATDLNATDTVNVILGCPHTLAGCETIHGNAPNFGGQPWIPTKNPVNKNNHT